MNNKFKYSMYIAHSLFALLLCYIVGNLPYSLSSEKQAMQIMEAGRRLFSDVEQTVPKDVLAVNVSYDKELVAVADKYGMPVGHLPITNRDKLLRLLDVIDSVGGYKYVVLDISFGDDAVTSADSALYSKIASMPRIVIANHNDVRLASDILKDKACNADYRITLNENGFVKYPYLDDGGLESMPLRMWHDTTGECINDYGLFCTSMGQLCRKSLFLSMPIQISEPYDSEGEKTWYNLGTDLLDEASWIGYGQMMKGKIIAIGSFVDDDIHDTYVGPMPGVVINLNAYMELAEHKHIVSFTSMFVLFFVFLIATVSVFRGITILQTTPLLRDPKTVVLRLLTQWIGLSFLFTCVFTLLYFFQGEVYDIFFIATYFTLLDGVLCFIRKIKGKEI